MRSSLIAECEKKGRLAQPGELEKTAFDNVYREFEIAGRQD